MHGISLKCAVSNASTSVSVYFDSWAHNRLFLSETSGHNGDRVIPCTVSVWFPFDRLLPISIKYDVTPINMLFTLKYTFYKKSIRQFSKMCHYLMAFRVRPLGLDHRRPTTKFLQFYVSEHLKRQVCFHLVVKPKCKHHSHNSSCSRPCAI